MFFSDMCPAFIGQTNHDSVLRYYGFCHQIFLEYCVSVAFAPSPSGEILYAVMTILLLSVTSILVRQHHRGCIEFHLAPDLLFIGFLTFLFDGRDKSLFLFRTRFSIAARKDLAAPCPF